MKRLSINNYINPFPSVPGGELFERIVAEEYLMEDDAVDYVKQILEALKFMHERNFVHLDLKVRGTSFYVFTANNLNFCKVHFPLHHKKNSCLDGNDFINALNHAIENTANH